jgi:hypothetical protein
MSEVGNGADQTATLRAGERTTSTLRRRDGGPTMSPYLMEKFAEYNQNELARARQKREWRSLFRK